MTATQWRRRVFKPVVFLACLEPLGWLVYNFLWGDLGVNPVETITNHTGIWTLRLIVITVAITPARWLTKWNPLIQYRRMLGLFAFFYGVLHFMTYFILDHQLAFEGLWDDVVKRPYITMGFTGFVLMIPLALTSTQGWIRRLGGRRWNLLHRLIYATVILAVIHYWWKVKLDTTNPRYYAILVAVLLGARVWHELARRRRAAVQSSKFKVQSSKSTVHS
jgi:sulfoxide reductase heme-binding subunit YedZ